MGAAAGWAVAAESGLAVGGEGAGGAGRAWLEGTAAGGEEADAGRRMCWTSQESELKKKKRQQEMHLRRSPDPAESRGRGQDYFTAVLKIFNLPHGNKHLYKN